jgi:hypothetical protein
MGKQPKNFKKKILIFLGDNINAVSFKGTDHLIVTTHSDHVFQFVFSVIICTKGKKRCIVDASRE